MDGRILKGLHKFAYLPFGAGARRCIGGLFAEAEMMLAVASIVQRFNVTATNAIVAPLAATTLRPGKGGVPVAVRPRSLQPVTMRETGSQVGSLTKAATR